ncbi:aldehyde dehydrogenase, partial [Streptomyces sp. SID10115]|nr:aldehyde dehydrogenase [Streptomyces sp. SID10115]
MPASASEEPVQQPLQLDALGPRGEFRARNRQVVPDVTGAPAAELSLVPPPFVSRAHSALRRAEPAPPDERVRRIAAAADLFATGTVAG